MSNSLKIKKDVIKVGDTIKISYKFKDSTEKEKEQIFQGILIAVSGSGSNKMFTVRKITKDKIGVERIFPVISPFIKKIAVVKKGNTRRAKLYFIRNLSEQELSEKLS